MMYKSISTLSEFLYKTKTIMAFAFPVAVVSVACPRSKGSLDAICLSGDPRFRSQMMELGCIMCPGLDLQMTFGSLLIRLFIKQS